MRGLTFDKSELGNLEYSLTREMLATDRRGGYMSSTIVCCNTRKYHGLIVSKIDDSDRDYVLLSSLDETIIRDGQRFNLALHRFRGVYEPRGHKYITDFEYTPTPTITYRIGDVVLRKELLWIHKRTQLMVRYTLVEGDIEQLTLQLRPFLAYRDRHALSKCNVVADGRSYPIAGGVKCKLYEGFPWLNMQISSDDSEFVAAPDWYHDFEYPQEIARGYEGYEDLLTPGYFEVTLKRGESVIFSAATDMMTSSKSITDDFETSIARRTHKIDFLSCLRHSARQFMVRNAAGEAKVIAGYPWYGEVGRETMISLPGITIEQGHKEDCMDVLDAVIKGYKSGTADRSYFPDNAVDTPLWFFRTLQVLEAEIGDKAIWERYGETMKELLDYYKAESGNITLHDNGLIWAWNDAEAISWMDTTIGAENSLQRNGYQVETNALWYNAVCYALELATKFKDRKFISEWEWVPERAKSTFQSLFWLNEGWLADFVNHETKDYAIRSNMIVACALKYKMLSVQQCIDVIRCVQQHLLTPKGLRSLSPVNPLYGVSLSGANSAPKNGSVWVWPLAAYVDACFQVSGASFLPDAEAILDNFKEDIQTYGIGSISEYFESDPPFNPRGAISQAWSVAAVLDISNMIEKYKAAQPAKRCRRACATKKSTATTTKSTTRKCATKKATTK